MFGLLRTTPLSGLSPTLCPILTPLVLHPLHIVTHSHGLAHSLPGHNLAEPPAHFTLVVLDWSLYTTSRIVTHRLDNEYKGCRSNPRAPSCLTILSLAMKRVSPSTVCDECNEV
jgi:hypothetical protein